MRRIVNRQSAIRAPLDAILGTEANVRILRVLSNATVPLGRAELRRATGLYPSGVPRVLTRLEDLGIVESVGRGRSRPVRLRQGHPLAPQLRALFGAELERHTVIEQNIQSAVQGLSPRPDAAWLEGAFATGDDAANDPIIVGLLGGPSGSETWEQQLRRSFLPMQRDHDIAIEIRIRWRADIEAANGAELDTLRRVRPLVGPPPRDLLGLSDPGETTRRPRLPDSHDAHDTESLRLARAIAEELRTKPDLVDEAVRYIDRRTRAASASEQLTLQEWRDILTEYSLARLRSFLTSDSPRARRLRQSLPFASGFAPDELERIRRGPRQPD